MAGVSGTPSFARYCIAHAAGPVLAELHSPLPRNVDAVRRRTAWHIPLDAREVAD